VKILAEDRQLYLAERAEATTGRTDPSPERNDPATCPHLAVDDRGWCAGCSTQVGHDPYAEAEAKLAEAGLLDEPLPDRSHELAT
jgi:hypothetical protein